MITCVLVYLTSGTISTLQHSEYSMWAWGSADNNDTNTSNITSVAPMQIFPKSGVSGADGARTRYSNSTFMLQKARFLRRQSDGDRLPTPQPILINDTDVNYDDSFNDSAADIHRIGEAALKYASSLASFIHWYARLHLILFSFFHLSWFSFRIELKPFHSFFIIFHHYEFIIHYY